MKEGLEGRKELKGLSRKEVLKEGLEWKKGGRKEGRKGGREEGRKAGGCTRKKLPRRLSRREERRWEHANSHSILAQKDDVKAACHSVI